LSEQKISNKKNRLLSWIIFIPTLIIVLLTIILGMFPALIITFSDKVRFPREINLFEPGIWMFPILIGDVLIFATIILYRKNKLPQKLTGLFRFFLNFEISHRTALVIVGFLIGSYALLNVGEIYTEETFSDYAGVKAALESFSLDDVPTHTKTIPFFFGYLSMEIFGSYRVAPFVASILCLFLTYLVTVKISKKRFAGIIALGIVLQSGNFLIYDTVITYPILWIMFYLLSIYFMFKRWPLSAISFAFASFSHPLTFGFLPITILLIALLDLPKRKKILLLSSYFALIVIGLVVFSTQIIPVPIDFISDSTSSDGTTSLDVSRIIRASASILSQFRYDGLMVIFLLPVVVCLFLASKKGISNANASLVLIGGIILLISFVPVITGMGNTPYRILFLVFFFAIGVGTLLSKNINVQDDLLAHSAFRDGSRKRDDEDKSDSEKNKERSDTIETSKHKSPADLRRAEERKKQFGGS